MGKKIDLTGAVIGRWTVICSDTKKGNFTMWKCRCECGTTRSVPTGGLLHGNSKSCGCLHKEIVSKLFRIRGDAQTKTYNAWRAMINRCYRENTQYWHIYGGRGIAVCNEWRESFDRFYQDMGDAPKGRYYLDRIDNNGNYCKENCRWATSAQNIRNRSNTFIIEWEGKKRLLVDVCDELGLRHATIYQRIAQRGWSVERALTPPRHYRTTPLVINKGQSYYYRNTGKICKVMDYFDGIVVLSWQKSGWESQCTEKNFLSSFKDIDHLAASLAISLPSPEND